MLFKTLFKQNLILTIPIIGFYRVKVIGDIIHSKLRIKSLLGGVRPARAVMVTGNGYYQTAPTVPPAKDKT